MTVARFRMIAAAEAVSWLVLIVATVAKHGFGVEGATTVIPFGTFRVARDVDLSKV